jgi:ribonuclease P protein component
MNGIVSGKQTFRKPERLVSRLAFETLLKEGSGHHVFPVRMIWQEMTLATRFPVQVAFSVPKRNFRRAVDRNRIKRLMRESYRKNKAVLYSLLTGGGKQFAVLFVYSGRKIPVFKEVDTSIHSNLRHLASLIQPHIG